MSGGEGGELWDWLILETMGNSGMGTRTYYPSSTDQTQTLID